MSDVNKALLAAALAGGYVLGRTKKARFALTVASAVVGRQLVPDPRQLLAQGARMLREIPQVAELGEQLRGEVLDAGRKAVTSATRQQLTTLADSLHERTLQLESGAEAQEEEEGGAEEQKRTAKKEAASGGATKKKASARKSAGKKPAAKKAPAKKSTTKKAAAKKAPAKKASAKKSAAKKSTTKKSAAKKTTTRRTAKKSAAKASARGERRR